MHPTQPDPTRMGFTRHILKSIAGMGLHSKIHSRAEAGADNGNARPEPNPILYSLDDYDDNREKGIVIDHKND